MAPVKSEYEKSTVYTVPYVKQTTQETSTKASNVKIKLCLGVLITALLVGGIVTAAYLLSSSGSRADQNLKTIEATFLVDGKDKREEIRIDRSSENAVFDDLTDEFTVVLDYGRNLAVFKDLKNNTCYFTNLEDIPMIENVMQQEEEGSVAPFFLADNEEGEKDGALIIGSIIVLPGDYVVKTSNEVVSNLCAASISFWGLVVEKPPSEKKDRHKRQLGPFHSPHFDSSEDLSFFRPITPTPCSLTCMYGCCFDITQLRDKCCVGVIMIDPLHIPPPSSPPDNLYIEEELERRLREIVRHVYVG